MKFETYSTLMHCLVLKEGNEMGGHLIEFTKGGEGNRMLNFYKLKIDK